MVNPMLSDPILISATLCLTWSFKKKCPKFPTNMYPDARDEKQRRFEFSTSTVNILNSLEQIGYRVVTSGSFVASQASSLKTE